MTRQAPAPVAPGRRSRGKAERRIPRATYRLQLNRDFTFYDAAVIVPYLDELGISDVYASPILKARAGSSHGYDVCDHSELNPDLGGEDGFNALVEALHKRRMGLIVDVVPNHMAINDACNRWWMDVLENGPSSTYATFFDIDWEPTKEELTGKVLLPILGDQYGSILEAGELKLEYVEGAFFIRYLQTVLPVAPKAYDRILTRRLSAVVGALGEEHPDVQELRSILTAIHHLPARSSRDPEQITERHREKEVVKRRIDALCRASVEIRNAIAESVADFNEGPDHVDLLDELLSVQAHRLAYWRVAAEEINYRRFFDVNEMAAIRPERPEVFHATHDLLLRLVAEGKITGLRIDHPDGLWAPTAYFQTLQERHAVGERPGRGALFVVAEKILSQGETLPNDWAVDGTTGYEFLSDVNGLFVDTSSLERMDRTYRQFTGVQTSFWNLTNSTKKMIMLVSLASEINALSHQLERIAEKNRSYRDFTLNSLTFAIREIMACLPVYRTYYAGQGAQSASDQARIRSATAEAKRRNPRTAESVFDFIEDTLLLRNLDSFRAEDRSGVSDFVMKFQQVSGPVMAKGVEDTAFYVYVRLASLNEVGSDPARYGVRAADFHRANQHRMRRWPHTMLATSTHDTKRSEDVRTRISALSEMPIEWREAVIRWSGMNARKKTEVEGALAPDANDEYLLYQTLIGAWPTEPMNAACLEEFRNRISDYMLKATKEAKVHTSWVNPSEGYDGAVARFVRALLPDDPNDPFIADLAPLQQRVSCLGSLSALSQTLLKLTSPGVPDIYQGMELPTYSLVDPDNRRPVDFEVRRAELDALRSVDAKKRSALARSLLADLGDGRAKLYVTHRCLESRRTSEALYATGRYVPLRAHGRNRRNVCAFARVLAQRSVVVVAPRLFGSLTAGGQNLPFGADAWDDTWIEIPAPLAGHAFTDVMTGARMRVEAGGSVTRVSLAALLCDFPVALSEG